MNYPYDKRSKMDESDGMDNSESDTMMDMAMGEADAIADDVEAFGMMSTPDNSETVDDGAENVMMNLDEGMGLDPFGDPDGDGSFEVFDGLEAARAGESVEMQFDDL